MSAAPFTDNVPDLLKRTLTHIVRVSVVLANGSSLDLDVEDCRVGWDETRAPRVQASVTCRVPVDQAVLDAIDPRAGARVEITLGYVLPGGVEQSYLMADLGLRDRKVSRPDDLMTLEATSDEALFIDNSQASSTSIVQSSTTAAMTYLLGAIIGLTSSDWTVGSFSSNPAVNVYARNVDLWDTLISFADQIGARIYDNGLRHWNIEQAPALSSPAHLVTVGQDGTIVSSDAGLSRDEGWGNSVLLVHEWTDASDVIKRITSRRSVTSGVYAYTLGNIRTVLVERSAPATQTQADSAAAALVARTVTRGRSFTLTAIAAYWLRPGMSIDVQLPLGGTERHLVTAVEFDPVAGLMKCTTRLPDNTGTIGA